MVVPAAADDHAASLASIPANLWPAPADGGQTLTAVVEVHEAGEYFFQVARGRTGAVMASHSFGHLESGTYNWIWDGRHSNGSLPAKGAYILEFFGSTDAGQIYFDVEERLGFTIRYSAESVTVRDGAHEEGTRHVDVSSVELTNAPDEVRFSYTFRAGSTGFTYVRVALDVNQLAKGYLASAQRTRQGRWKTSLSLAQLASDQGRPRPIECRRAHTDVEARVVTTAIPRDCLSRGGRSVRAEWMVSDGHYHYDGGDTWAPYWTKWTTFQNAPR